MNKHFQNTFTVRLDVFCSYTGEAQIFIYATLEFWQDLIKTKYFMTMSILALKENLTGKSYWCVFFVGYMITAGSETIQRAHESPMYLMDC